MTHAHDITAQDLAQHIDALLVRHHDARVIAFHDKRDLTSHSPLEVQGRRCHVVHAPSALAVHHALWSRAGEDVLVIVTPLTEQHLGEDVKARFLGRRLHDFDPWRAVCTMLKTNPTQMDDRLRSKRSLGRSLIRHGATSTYAPVKAGRLSEEIAWQRLLCGAFGLPDALGDLVTWLLWSIEHPASLKRLMAERALVDDLKAHVGAHIGPLFEVVWALWQAHAQAASPGSESSWWGWPTTRTDARRAPASRGWTRGSAPRTRASPPTACSKTWA